MKAMIFAAGLGSRLKPYTESMPKALVPVAGIPMIEILVKHLQKQGITDIIVNVHHFAEQVIAFLEQNKNFDVNIAISHEEELLLDTGGGLKKAAWFFNDQQPFLVQNVDVISDVNYQDMLDFHNSNESLATLAVCKRETSRYFLFDKHMQLCGWENTKTSEIKMARSGTENLVKLAFSGIHIIDPSIFSYMNQKGKFSIVDTYLELATTNKIKGFEHNAENWLDMGKPDELVKAEIILRKLINSVQ
ncbi:MAG: nucleotidyltransferase family protein [Lentimicrobiaceae bacterium]|jgi:NDP-sugar pyrophosphorylase family protein